MDRMLGLWELLGKNKIVVPMIQRDYAQGRASEEALRRRFLKALRQAVFSEAGQLSLDFVYGCVEAGGRFLPMDGQQRLTTLWLLHWYVALRAGVLKDGVREVLAKFSYETRMSTKDFCRRLCRAEMGDLTNGDIVSTLRKQTWYCASYEQDPTVHAMLTMLGGTVDPETGLPNEDGIEPVLRDCSQPDFQRAWNRLVSAETCPIVFNCAELRERELPQSDDLYIKMNARGKALSGFENFKADLLGYGGGKLVDLALASALDNAWMDVFWANRSADGCETDDIYLEMFRRYMLNWFLAESDAAGRLPALTVSQAQASALYRRIYLRDADSGKQAGRSRLRVKYEGLMELGPLLEAGALADMRLMMDRFSAFVAEKGLAAVERMLSPAWAGGEAFSFVPTYVEGSDPDGMIASLLTMKGRVAFYAACRYFERNERPDESGLRRWMRFAWNIIENGALETAETMIGALRFFRKVSEEHTADIGGWLAQGAHVDSDFATRQLKEESQKARLEALAPEVWTERIVRAERAAFLKGYVGYLFRNGAYERFLAAGDPGAFDARLAKVEAYFDAEGVREEKQVALTEALVKGLPDWESFYDRKFCDTSADRWRGTVFLKPEYADLLDRILTAENLEDLRCVSFPVAAQDAVKKRFLKAGVLSRPGVVGNGRKWRFRFQYPSKMLGFYQDRQQSGFYVFDYDDGTQRCNRNDLLLNMPPATDEHGLVLQDGTLRIRLDGAPGDTYGVGLFRTWDVRFFYRNRDWLWSRYRDGNYNFANHIYLMSEGVRARRPEVEVGSECERYFALDGNSLVSHDQLRHELDRLISEADACP